MSQVMVVCPYCRGQNETGLQTTSLTFFKDPQSLSGKLSCANCGHKISWTKQDLFLKTSSLLPTNLKIYASH
jgi:C4-type Zn-finger protein